MMVVRVSLSADDERHENCVVCKGDKTSAEVIECQNQNCAKVCHTDCDETGKFQSTLETWFCSVECQEEENPKVPEQKVCAESQQVAALKSQIKQLSNALSQSTDLILQLRAELSVKIEENGNLQSQITSIKAIINPPHVQESQATQNQAEDDSTMIEASDTLRKFNEICGQRAKSTLAQSHSLNPQRIATTPTPPKSPASRDVTSRNVVTAEIHQSSSYLNTTMNCSSATLVSKERIRQRMLNENPSPENHHRLDEKELLRLKLARQQLDELNKFKGDQNEWLGFEEEVYSTWDAGEYSKYEMIKKLRKALDGDAKNYVKLALSAPEADPENVMEILRRKYFHPNEAVSKALRDIMSMSTLR